MSMWRKTLEYLGLQEEQEDYDVVPERFAAGDQDQRPAMHDTTGPIPVVRPDDGTSSRLPPAATADADQPPLRPVADPDLTEPVSTVPARGGRGGGVPVDRDGARARSGSQVAPRADRSQGRERERSDRGDRRPARRDADRRDNVRPLRPEDDGHGQAGIGRRVAIVAVGDYEGGAREVGQRFRQRVPVVFDLTDAPAGDRRRVLDFVAGVTYGLHGEMLKVGARSFLAVPEGGNVSEEEWQRLAGLGYHP